MFASERLPRVTAMGGFSEEGGFSQSDEKKKSNDSGTIRDEKKK